jgi:hypothetical protein
MQRLKNSIVLMLVAFFFLASSGVIMHHHYCKKDGHSVNFYLPVKHACSPISEVDTCTTDSCCKTIGETNKKSSSPQAQKEPCCTDAFQYVQLDQDYVPHSDEIDELTYISVLASSIEEIGVVLQFVETKNGRAPPLIQSLTRRLAILQQYLI